MKVHLKWIGAAALVATALSNLEQAGAQYAPYQPQQQALPQVAGYPTTAQPAVAPAAAASAAPANRYQTPNTAASAAPVAPTYSQYPQTATQIPAYSYPQTTYPQTAQAPSYPAYSGYPSYPSVAQKPNAPMPVESEAMPAPTAASPHQGDAAAMANSTGCGCNSYPATGYQTANGYSGYGQAGCGYTDYGIAGACEPECGGHVWFGGLYWLFMERDNPNTQKLMVRVDHNTATDPYYPQANTTVLSTDQTNFDFRSGVEVRFGSTFSIGSACDEGCGNGYGYGNACGGNCAPSDNFAWEVAWWGLDEDNQDAAYYDQDLGDNIRLYGMVNFAGLEYYDGGAWRPVNEYYGYDLPIPDPGNPVWGQRTRSYFSAQNIELNLIRFPVCDMGCGGGSTCGGGACGCEPECTPMTYSMCGMCGVRYFRIDDDFYYGSEWASASWINYDVNVDNTLIGPQVGWNMNYGVGCKWNFFCNSTFGIFNNHIQSHQRVWGDTGPSRYTQTGDRFNSNADKDDISFLGELRLGGSYDISCNWRAVLAYRALAITGVATSVDQIPTDFTNSQYPGIIDSDSSIVIHGVQAGVECRY